MTFKENALQRHVYEIDSPWFLPDGWWNVRKWKEGRMNEGRNRRVKSTKSIKSTAASVIPLLSLVTLHVRRLSWRNCLHLHCRDCFDFACSVVILSVQQQIRHALYPQVRA
jgi:hypothetical protein